MKKVSIFKLQKKWIIAVSVLLILSIAFVFYVSTKLPDELNIRMFTKGVIGVELLNKDFVKLDETIYFYKSKNVAPLIEYYEANGYIFDEQFGSGYVFYQNDQRYNFSTQTVTRRYSIMLTQ